MLYVATEMKDPEALFAALRVRRPVELKVQKYVMEDHHKAYQPVWAESLTVKIKPDTVSNDICGDETCLLAISGKCVELCLPEAKDESYAGSVELCGCYTEILFDTERLVGVVTDAHDFTGRVPRQVIAYPRMNVLNARGDLKTERYLRDMCIPAELMTCKALLKVLGQHQK